MNKQSPVEAESGIQRIKCVVWDLDNTIWQGTLLEDKQITLCPEIPEILKKLDQRGILQSIASKNEHDLAMAKLQEYQLDHFFIYPQINWNQKSSSIKNITESINIGIDTLAFIDDQPFEREEVNFVHPQVMCLDAADLNGFLDLPQLNPRFITEDSQYRRQMYQSDIKRNSVKEDFQGTEEDFLASLNMRFTISMLDEHDLQRAEELTVRTHQLNATGYTYSYEELDELRKSPYHKLYIAGLEDK